MPASNPARRPTFQQFTAVRRYGLVLTFAPDGTELAYITNISGQYNLWRQASTGGYPHQLTFYTDQAVRQACWSPDGQTIVYTADRQGDEFHQLYTVPAQGGAPEQLTDAARVQHYLADPAWSPDGRYIAYCGNDREPMDMDVLVREMESGEVRRPLAGEAYYIPVSWSPDGARLAVYQRQSNTDSDVLLLTPDDGAVQKVTPHDGEVKFEPGPWAAHGSGFYLLTDEGREFTGLAFYNLATGKYEWVATPEWDVEYVSASQDGRYLAWAVNENGYSRLYVRDLTTRQAVNLPPIPDGVIMLLQLAPTGDKLALLLTRAGHSPEILVVDLAAGTTTQITDSMLGGLTEADLVQPELVHYPTHDGRQIPAFLYRPRATGRVPVVLSIHGGPESQERPTYAYSGLYQYLTSRGIAVLAPNVRGSTGYGKTYQKLIHRDWGGAELKDFESAVQYLRGLDWVDPTRIGLFGGSFGGFATLSCVARLPDYWAAAVDLVGPSNLVTFAEAVPPTWKRWMAAWVGDPETEADFLLERSPITYADQIRTPLFVIQGAKDPRVVQGESDQLVETLRTRGVDVKYDIYEDEGHGFTKRENELRAMHDSADFLERHLLPAPS